MAATIPLLLLFISIATALWGFLPATLKGLRPGTLTFELHHDNAALNTQSGMQIDAQDRANRQTEVAVLKTRPMTVYRPTNGANLALAPIPDGTAVEWNRVEVQGPDTEDRLTLLELAKMTANAYSKPGHNNWYDLDDTWNTVGTCTRL